MRTFYIFNINNEFKTLTRNNPYNLFKTFEEIYYSNKDEQNYELNMYEYMTKPIEQTKLNKILFNQYHNNDHYTKFMNTHIYNNYYSDEVTKLTIGKAFIVLKSTSSKPFFLPKLLINTNLFACDFQNQDYFWLESIA